MTREKRLAAIEARVRAATEGPWSIDDSIGEICIVSDATKRHIGCYYDFDRDVGERDRPDTAFIANARADVPWLLGLVQRYEAALKDAKVHMRPECSDRECVCSMAGHNLAIDMELESADE